MASSMKCIDIDEGHIKVRWLLALAQRGEDVAWERELLPAEFPNFKWDKDLAKALGAKQSAFSNWFPDKPHARNTLYRPPPEIARNLARIFGFAPPSDDDHVWREWWAKSWPSFMPSEDDNTNRRKQAPAEAFKAQYREALKNKSLTFRPPIVSSDTLTIEDNTSPPPAPIPHEQAGTEVAKPAETTVTPPPTPTWPYWPIFLVSAVIFIACGYATATYWKHTYYPTVDLVRTIDFSELACDAEGNKHDVVYIYDDYTVIRNFFHFETYEKVADLRRETFSVDVYDLNSEGSKVVAIHSDTNHERRLQSHILVVRNSHVRPKWIWTNAHSNPREGTAVTGGWILRDLTVNYTLPVGRDVTELGKHTPPVAQKQCKPRGRDSIYCPALYTTEEVQIWWDWNVWDGCKNR